MAREKRKCPFHKDDTASLVRYPNAWYCHGACAKAYTVAEVSDKGINAEYEGDDDEKEDVTERLQYIKSLKRVNVRGFEFPADDRGFYIVWPDSSFYKYRLFEPGKGSKYIGPKGVKPPLFWARQEERPTLVLIEGEINALSVALAMPGWDVCSPGAASMFSSDNLSKHLTTFKRYSNMIVVLDDDVAGTKGLIESRAAFLYKLPFVRYTQISPDCNEILVSQGQKALRAELQGFYCE